MAQKNTHQQPHETLFHRLPESFAIVVALLITIAIELMVALVLSQILAAIQ